ncbi:hypothetical protein Asi02nite_30740 [Asanoa siamensis]|uniref:Fumarylacetoacetase-like C-terminal domain-containing protein n=1 Tax=Asanoa siamensis TaxID=926357 RepID=A0ABQ4CQH6_9ACTN|nr:hypothetical protein Asi02nite_30740 [Asanoa siamensis]
MNYAAHAAESGAAPPEQPVMFYKAPNTVVGPDDEVLIPRASKETDWEVELAVVIGRRARYLSSPSEALDYVAGYAIANDVSERELQLRQSGGQWSKGKSCETFNPLGPWLVTADEIADPQTLRLRSWVNGEPRQDSSTADGLLGGHADPPAEPDHGPGARRPAQHRHPGRRGPVGPPPLPRRGQIPPRTTRPHHVQDRVDDLPPRMLLPPPLRGWFRQQRLDQSPLGIGQIRRVTTTR